MISQIDNYLYSAICRSISNIEQTTRTIDGSNSVISVACDALHTLAGWFHAASSGCSFALLVRLKDKRVLATTCDHELVGNDTLVDVSACSHAIARLNGERLFVGLRTTEFLNALTTNTSSSSNNNNNVNHWFEEKSFELNGDWLKPYEFVAFAQTLVATNNNNNNNINDNDSNRSSSTMALLILKSSSHRRSSSSSMRQYLLSNATSTVTTTNRTTNSIATTSTEEPTPPSSRTSSTNSVSSFVDSSDCDTLMNSERETVAVREAVLSIDDQYVVACNIEGKIAAISPIADALFERHGASNSVDISDSLKGGQKTWNTLIGEQSESPICVALRDGTPCTIRISPTLCTLYIIVIESVGATPSSSPSSPSVMKARSRSSRSWSRSNNSNNNNLSALTASGDETDPTDGGDDDEIIDADNSSIATTTSTTRAKNRVKRRVSRSNLNRTEMKEVSTKVASSHSTSIVKPITPLNMPLLTDIVATTEMSSSSVSQITSSSNESSRFNAIISWIRRQSDSNLTRPTMTATNNSDNSGRIISNYQLIQEISRGGEGVIYKGIHLTAPNESVAVKKRHCNDISELNVAFQEALTLARVNSDFVVRFRNTFFEQFVMEGKQMFELFIVTEYCNGGDLFNKLLQCSRDRVTHSISKEALAKHTALPLQQWTLQICSAVNALHEIGIAHRDIKLENFVIRENGSLCLIDFGISAVYHDNGIAISGAIDDDTNIGSTYYLAPESFARNGAVSSRITNLNASPLRTTATNNNNNLNVKFSSDLWAVGVVLLELTTCHLFQIRKDRLVLGKLAYECNDDTVRWQSQLAPFKNDISATIQSNVIDRIISSLLDLNYSNRATAASIMQLFHC